MLILPTRFIRRPPFTRIVTSRPAFTAFGQAPANGAPPYIGAGAFYPGGLVSPNNWDSWDFTSLTDLSQVPDSTSAVQQAINAAQATGTGGVVQLPPGVIRVNGATISGGGVTIQGTGWEDTTPGSSPATRGKRGTYILTDVGGTAFTIAQSATNVKILNLAFIQPQPPDAGGWTPLFPNFSVVMLGPSAGNALIEKCLFWGVKNAISIGTDSASPPGLITIRDCEFAVFQRPIQINGCSNTVIDNVKVTTVPLAGNTNQLAWMATNSIGIFIQSAQSCAITASYFNGYNIAMYSTIATTPAQIKSSDCTVVNCSVGIEDIGVTTVWKVQGYSFTGFGAGKLATAISLNGTGCFMDVTDCQLANFAGSAVHGFGGGVGQLRFGPNLSINNWNLSPGLDGTIPNPSPAITCDPTSGTSGVWYSLNGSRFVNANGGPNTGGGGTFTTY